MMECRLCQEPINKREDDLPSRCPRCREPLFERPGGPDLVSEGGRVDRGVCALHPENVAIGACKRCGNYYCPVCRTRWEDLLYCVSCVETLAIAESAKFKEKQGHGRQALFGFWLGVMAWACLLFMILCLIGASVNPNNPGLIVMAVLLGLGSILPSGIGIGQSFYAIRVRGARMLMATAGLVLCGLHLGAFLGLALGILFFT